MEQSIQKIKKLIPIEEKQKGKYSREVVLLNLILYRLIHINNKIKRIKLE